MELKEGEHVCTEHREREPDRPREHGPRRQHGERTSTITTRIKRGEDGQGTVTLQATKTMHQHTYKPQGDSYVQQSWARDADLPRGGSSADSMEAGCSVRR